MPREPAVADALLGVLHAREGRLRDRLRAREPAELGRDSARRPCSMLTASAKSLPMPVLEQPTPSPSSRGGTAIPSRWLGMHCDGAQSLVRVFLPWARRLWVVDARHGDVAGELARIHADGLFAGMVGRRGRAFPIACAPRAATAPSSSTTSMPSRRCSAISTFISSREGTHPRATTCWARIAATIEGVAGVAFAVWAPNARRVSVVGDFNDWDGRRHPMRLRHGAACGRFSSPASRAGTLLQIRDRRSRRRGCCR